MNTITAQKEEPHNRNTDAERWLTEIIVGNLFSLNLKCVSHHIQTLTAKV